jgi:hypothetical protein
MMNIMDLFEHLCSFSDSSWIATLVFGSLAWLPIRTLALKIRRLRRKDRSILRGGRFTRDNDLDQGSVLALVFRTITNYIVDALSWKNSVSFGEHSDGTVLSKRYVYDRKKAPKEGVVLIEVKTPSPVNMEHKRRTRIATPVPNKAGFLSMDKENVKPVLEAQSPNTHVVDTMPSPNSVETTATQHSTTQTITGQPTLYQKQQPQMPDPDKVIITPYQPQPVPLVLVEKPPCRQPSLFDQPRDANFLLPFTYKANAAALKVAITTGSQNASYMGSTKKRKLNLDSSDIPRKRLMLKHTTTTNTPRIIRKTRSLNPSKRKEREEALLQEFNRKRPKQEVLTATDESSSSSITSISTRHVSNPFGSSSSSSISEDDTTTASAKPTFRFGGVANSTTDQAKAHGKPAFQFGASTSSSEDAKVDGKPAFQFGASTSSSEDAKADGKPAFQFGANGNPVPDTESDTTSNDTRAKPGFTFGSGSTALQADRTAASEDSVQPAFSFGKSASETPAQGTDESGPKPAFSFGAGSQTAPAEAVQPAFTFGGTHTVSGGGTTNPSFSFAAAPAQGGFAAGTMLPGPTNGGGILRRRLGGRKVGGRIVRRGAA